MNWLVLLSGIAALSTTVGHFTLGKRDYLSPMLEASFDPLPKKVMLGVFHYVSAFLILATLALLALGLGVIRDGQPSLLVRFIALNYLGFAIAQISIAATSSIEKPLSRMFQWVFFMVVAILAWLGA